MVDQFGAGKAATSPWGQAANHVRFRIWFHHYYLLALSSPAPILLSTIRATANWRTTPLGTLLADLTQPSADTLAHESAMTRTEHFGGGFNSNVGSVTWCTFHPLSLGHHTVRCGQFAAL
jgi:hypothetical protein